MLEDGKISNRQAIFLIIITIISTTNLLLPTMIYGEAKQDSWLSVVVVTVFGVIAACIITSLGLMFKDKTIVQYSEIIAGKVPGKVIGLIYCVFFIHTDIVIVREFSEFLAGSFLTQTPILVFSAGIILASVYAVRNGLEVISRVNEIVFPLFITVFIGIFALTFSYMEFKNLTPVLADGLMPVAKGAYLQALFFGETIVMAMFIPYLNIPQKARRSSIIAVFVIGLLGVCMMIGVVAIFGIQVARLNYPFMSLARYISVADFLERMDPLIVFMWIGGVFVKIAVFHYCAVLALAQWLNLKDYRPLAVPVGVIMVVFSIILWENILELTGYIEKILSIPYLIVETGIPSVLLITAKLKRKGERT